MLGRLRGLLLAEGMGGPALIMLIATVGGGACNFIYQVMMQNLIPSAVSEINTLLAILYIFAVPAGAVQNVMTRYSAKYHALGKEGSISWLMRRTLTVVLVLGIIASTALAIVLNIPEVHSALKLTSETSILLIATAVTISLITPIGTGPLQGLQRFTLFGIEYGTSFLLKLAMGVALVLLGLGVAGAIGGALIGITFGAVFSFVAVRKYLLAPGEKSESREVWRFTVPTMVAALGFTVLTNVDVILAALLFEKDAANYYTGASMLAKIILFLPSAMAAVMFPKIAKIHAERGETWKVLKIAFASTILLAGLATSVFVIAPEFVLNTLVPGANYPLSETASVLRVLAVAMNLLGLANLFMLYGLATDGHAYIAIQFLSMLAMFAMVGGIVASGTVFTPDLLALVMVATGGFIIALSTVYLFVIEREMRWWPGTSGLGK